MDTLLREHADEADVALIDSASAYDHQAQKWVQADHAHFDGDNLVTSPVPPLLFCGADRVTCERDNEQGAWR